VRDVTEAALWLDEQIEATKVAIDAIANVKLRHTWVTTYEQFMLENVLDSRALVDDKSIVEFIEQNAEAMDIVGEFATELYIRRANSAIDSLSDVRYARTDFDIVAENLVLAFGIKEEVAQ
jgi:hypothetical protein